MKKILIAFSLTCSLFAFSQAPQGINYQAVIRNTSGTVVSSSTVGLQFRIVQGSITGATVYKEKFTAQTTNLGLVNVVLGQGTPLTGTFNTINWATGPYFLEIAADAAGGTNYTVLGIQQMASVPYALYAEKSGTPGTPGPQGATGATGATGAQGPIGLTGATGPAGTNGTNGQNALAKTTTEAAGSNCTTGGVKIEYGLDANNNGTLDVAEINAALTKYVCNGAVGATGAQGAQGIQGATGAQGPIGLTGATGPTGAQGPIGLTGATGAQGIQGAVGTNGTNGTNGQNALAKTTTEAAGANCTTGGVKVEYGLDANNNGSLDVAEINPALTKYVCNGATGAQGPIGLTGSTGATGATGLQGANGTAGTNGQNALAKTTTEAAGANCTTGGVKVEYGLDANNNGTLDVAEINAALTKYVCNGAVGATGETGTQGIQGATGVQGPIGLTGATGVTGPAGTNGQNTLAKTTTEAAGANCSTGGVKVEYGIDTNNNGTLDVAEINATLTKYICNGATGAQGPQGPQGIQGATGAQGIQGETGAQGPIGLTGSTGATGATGTQGIQGATGPAGTNGQNTLAKTTTEAAGANCTTGGVKVEYGLDTNNNGTLDVAEINAALTKYVCNGGVGATGATGAQGIQGATGAQGPIGLTGNTGATGAIGAQGIQGAAGTNGTNGTNGQNALAKTTTEAAGANCTTGGIKVEYGLDANNNGTLDATEINAALSKYVCNGADGASGAQGIQGLAGNNGTNGNDGVGISSTINNGNGTFTFNYTNGTTFTTSLPTSTGSGFQIFESSGTFTVPSGVTKIIIEGWGAGGGGCSSNNNSWPQVGCGGGGGAYGKTFISVIPNQVINITLGIGGVGGVTNNNTFVSGSSGSSTIIGSYLSIGGGNGGSSTVGGSGGICSAIFSQIGSNGGGFPSGQIGGSGGTRGGMLGTTYGNGGSGAQGPGWNNGLNGQNGLVIIYW